jgi:hypothetical protein
MLKLLEDGRLRNWSSVWIGTEQRIYGYAKWEEEIAGEVQTVEGAVMAIIPGGPT